MVTETEIGIETTLKFKLLSFSLLFLIPSSSSQPFAVCDNETSFVTDTKYHTNLNTVFHSLSSNATAPASNLFFSTSAGATTSDSVFGLFICRGDVNASSCHDCVSTATTTDLPITYCANRKVAIIWYDACMVRYSDQALLGKLALDPEEVAFDGPSVDANSTQLNLLLAKTMDELTSEVAAGDKSGKKFAVRETNLTESEDLYVLAQCTPDLSSGDCKECLKVASQSLFVKKEGAVVFLPSCMVQYETYYPPIPSNSSGNGGTGIKSDVGKKKVSAKEVVIIVASVIFVLLGLILTAVYVIKKKAKKQDLLLFGSGGDFATVESLQYDLATLQSATNNFSDENKLGQGGFGTVYKGRLSNGQEIAVKRLSTTSGQGVQEFKNEVLLVAKLQHRNLVRLLGFCISGQEKLLVYEFVSNGSLDYLLFDPEKQGQLDWAKRYDIIRGVARGMLYLHQESRMKIIHRDLKASNVLLDTDMNPKISDFGVARIFGVDQTQGNTNKVVGTYGYMAPEYALHGRFSVKSDVYSFGVLVLEIVSGKKNSSFYESGYADGLLSYAWKQWREETVLEFVDPKIRESCLNNEVMRCIHLSLLCVQESMHERPTMAKVVLKLDSHALSLPSPHQPAFFFINHENESTGFTRYAGSDQWVSRSFPVSVNDASISEMEPR